MADKTNIQPAILPVKVPTWGWCEYQDARGYNAYRHCIHIFKWLIFFGRTHDDMPGVK